MHAGARAVSAGRLLMNRNVHGFTPLVGAKVVAPKIHAKGLLAQLTVPFFRGRV